VALKAVTGFGFGTTLGWTTGNAGNKLFDTITGTPTITAVTPRTGTYCLEISATAAAEAVAWSTATLGASQTRGRAVFAIRFVASLPTADVILASFTATANAEFRFNQAAGAFAVVYEGGTQTVGPTVVADTWYVVEMYADMSTGGAKTIAWWVDGASQTQHTSTGAADTIAAWEFGCSFATQTMTVRFDDAAVWTDTAAISGPVGEQKVYFLTVDVAGTASQIGTVNSTARFTANGTVDSTFNSANILAALDDVPPTIGSTADGVAQRAAGTTSAVELPMTTVTLAGNETLTSGGVRVLVVGWASGTAANTIGLRAFNGTAETTLFAAADPGFDASTTTPAWLCRMYAGLTNQTQLSAFTVRYGYSGDISPVPGAHAIYAEVAVTVAGAQVAAASLAATATLTAGATPTANAGATLAATVALAAAAAMSTAAGASLAATATLGTTTGVERQAAATLAATATLSAAVTAQRPVTAALTATATLTVGTAVTALATTSIAATVTLSATATATLLAGAALPVVATLAAVATVTSVGVSATADLPVTATMTTATIVTGPAAASLPVTAALLATGLLTAAATATLPVTATLTAAAARSTAVAATMPVTAALAAAPTVTAVAVATLAVTAALSAAVGAPPLLASVTLAATATLTAAAVETAVPAASLPVTATLTVITAATHPAAAVLALSVALAAGFTATLREVASLAVVATLAAVADVSGPATYGEIQVEYRPGPTMTMAAGAPGPTATHMDRTAATMTGV
jgi:hypothetical protein